MPPSGPLILSQVIGIRSITCMHAPSATSPRDTARALNPRKHGRFIKTLRKKQTTPCIAVCLWWGLVCHLCEASGARLEATRLLSDGRGRVGLETAGILDVGVRRRRIDSGGKDGGRILADLTGLRHVIALILVSVAGLYVPSLGMYGAVGGTYPLGELLFPAPGGAVSRPGLSGRLSSPAWNQPRPSSPACWPLPHLLNWRSGFLLLVMHISTRLARPPLPP
ncbi:unnamed protein product [Cutaneotrichosporon oleaginosum]